MITTSGLKQKRDGQFYMQGRDEVTHAIKEILVEFEEQKEPFDLHAQGGHVWHWEREGLMPSPCGRQNCTVCHAAA
jgi:hypothetical protein